MSDLPEYLVEVTVVYVGGQRETITLKHRDYNEESARNSIRNHFKALEENGMVESITINLHGMHLQHASNW